MKASPTAVSTLAGWRHWLALWLGWLVMGQLGSVMAWSWFSGLGGVVAWWCWLQWAPWRWQPRSWASRWAWLLLTLAGMAAVMLAGRHLALGWLGWVLAVVGWGQILLGLRQWPTDCTAPLQRGWMSWVMAPLLACAVAAVAADPTDWPRLWPVAGALFLLAAWPTRQPAPRMPAKTQTASAAPAPAIARAATLLMMGSLPLMSAWCLANGQSVLWGTAVHLWAMAWASQWTQTLLNLSPRLPLRTRCGVGNLLLVNAALVAWLGSSLWHMALVVALLAAATTVWQSSTHATAAAPSVPAAPTRLGWLPPLWPPLCLLWLGHQAPTQGPQALIWALATLTLLALLHRQASPWPARNRPLSPASRPASLNP